MAKVLEITFEDDEEFINMFCEGLENDKEQGVDNGIVKWRIK